MGDRNDREEFRDLLYSIFYESVSDPAIIHKQHEKIRMWIQANIPSKLYRYRNVNAHTLDAFKKDEIWGSSVYTFNDPFECMPHCDPNRAKDILKMELNIEQIAEKFRAYQRGDDQTLQAVFSSEQLQQIFANLPPNIHPNTIKKPFSLFCESVLRLFESCQNEFERIFYSAIIDEQIRRSIACFTESNDYSAMWGHYADSHRGFCLEYDFRSCIASCSENCADIQSCTNLMMVPAIAPVVYADVRYDATYIVLPLLLSRLADIAHIEIKPIYEDLMAIVKSLLTKSMDWSYEKEWRMFSAFSDNAPFHSIYRLRSTAVYIGARTSKEDAEALYEVCCEKNIPCYKMIPAYLDGHFSLRPIEYKICREALN